jgi:hypothetical protein
MARGPGEVRPLCPKQQRFLQLLLSRHVLPDGEARAMHGRLLREEERERGQGTAAAALGSTLEACLGRINASLLPGFGLEVRTVALDARCVGAAVAAAAEVGAEAEAEEGDSAAAATTTAATTTAASGQRRGTVRYHAVVNRTADAASKGAFLSPAAEAMAGGGGCGAGTRTRRSPHEMAHLRLILQRLVEGDGNGTEAGSRSGAGSGGTGAGGCPGILGRIAALNLRNELEGPHEGKLPMGQAEASLHRLVAEGWLVPAAAPPDDDDDDDDDDDADADEECRRPKRRRRRRRGGGGRTSLDGLSEGRGDGGATHLAIGPRTYMELPDLLRDLGLERVPQFILHGAG